MSSVCIVHFQPIERYPPVFNLLRYLAAKQYAVDIHVITSDPGKEMQQIAIPGITIHRIVHFKKNISKWKRILLYALFIVKAFFLLLRYRPASVLYYETLSAGAPCLYAKFFKIRLMVHYHEYISPTEYKNGMVLNRWLHKCEQFLYKKASWVSHTNYDRQRLFLTDVGNFAPLHNFILPNYPPASWKNKTVPHTNNGKTGFVYVGALDTETMYLKEVAGYIAANPATCYWDIYSENYSAGALEFLNKQQAPNIHFKGAVPYDSLPEILSLYQVGLIMYNGHIPNYVYNAPNKLFEYAVCGLDVWFPAVMKSSLTYVTTNTWPKIIALDFQSLGKYNLQQLTDRTESRYVAQHFTNESALQPIIQRLSE
ncbi:MAG: hypothetical protein ABJC98_07355 [Bacteroidota bacterium]